MKEIILAVTKHANEHYEDGGWDVLVECWSYNDYMEFFAKNPVYSVQEALDRLLPLVEVWAERQADARNSAF
jgi:hypothetical protein